MSPHRLRENHRYALIRLSVMGMVASLVLTIIGMASYALIGRDVPASLGVLAGALAGGLASVATGALPNGALPPHDGPSPTHRASPPA